MRLSTTGWNETRADFSVRVTMEATVAPSEDPKKVLDAMKNILVENAVLIDHDSGMVKLISDKASSLSAIRNQLRDRHIRGAARKLFLSELKGDSTSLMLNRQAATAGVAALCSVADESPLGPIYMIIRSNQITTVVDWLTAYDEG